MTLSTRVSAALVVAVLSLSACSSTPEPLVDPAPSTAPAVDPVPSAAPDVTDPAPEAGAAEPADVQAYCDAIQAVHDAPDTPLGTPSPARVEATEQVAELAPTGERDYWLNLALVYDNTQDRDVHSNFARRYQEVDDLVRARCGFGSP